MSDLKLGLLIDTAQQRDAIHIAVAPVVATERLAPGQHIGFVIAGDTAKVCHSGDGVTGIGIVDPFLKAPVFQGERFWMFLYPQTIQGLRHDWTHPAFVAPEPSALDKSKAWLADMAKHCGVSYERMMSAIETDDYIHMGDNEAYKDWLENTIRRDEFKHHCEIVLGRQLSAVPYPFSCAC